MPWSLDKTSAIYHITNLDRVAQEKFDRFQNAIHHQGLHPRVAAEALGDVDYKCLNGTNIFQFRLTRYHRVHFLLDEATQTVRVLGVGGHT